MKNKFIIGIDPGKGGGIVTLSSGNIKTIDKMPAGPKYLWHFFISLGFPNMIDRENTWVYIENVHAMPNDAKSSIWTFAQHMGHIEMTFELFDITPVYVIPRKWQKWLSASSVGLSRDKEMTKHQWKKALAEAAREDAPEKWKKSITLATADAYWIAKYGWEEVKNGKETENSLVSENKIPIVS